MVSNRHKPDVEAGEAEGQNRRDFLKSGAAALGTAGLTVSAMTVEAATNNGLSLGKTNFVEVFIEHEIPDDQSPGHADGLQRYSINRRQSVMGLVANPAVDIFVDSDVVVTTGRDFVGAPGPIHGEDTSVIVTDAEYPTASENILFLESEYTRPEIEIHDVSGQSITGEVAGNPISVRPGDEVSMRLPQAEVTVTRDIVRAGQNSIKTITVVPTATVRNNGPVEVFGKSGHYVVPRDPENPFAQAFINMFQRQSGSERVTENGRELFVVKRGDDE